MRSSLNIVALGALAAAASAQVVPTAPGPGEVFNVGSKCNIEWNLDTTGKWTSFEIQLMTGSNLAMVPVQMVATGLDGTSGSGTVDFTCPDVTPNSAIYFYQFSQAGQPTSWTTRFTIAGTDGSTTPPTQSTNGIAWGTGSLVGESGSAGSSAAAGGAADASTSRATGRSRSVAATGASGLASLAAASSVPSAVTVTSVISQSSAMSSISDAPVSTVTMTSSPSSSASSSSSASAAGQSSSSSTSNNNSAGSTLTSSVALVLGAAALALAV